jgi:hypothetical protein
MVAACSMFRGKLIGSLGFSRRGEYRKGGVRRWTRLSHPWWRSQGLGRATLGCGRPVAPLRLIFGLREASVKIGGLAFFHPILRIFPV